MPQDSHVMNGPRSWAATSGGRRIAIERRGGSIHVEQDPADEHELLGESLTIEAVRRGELDVLDSYDGLRPTLLRDFADRYRVVDSPTAALTTVTAEGEPHAVPCCFVIEGDVLHTPVDQVKAKSTMDLRRLRNIVSQPRVSLLVDHYDDDWSRLWWARLDGTARILDEPGRGRDAATGRLRDKYEQYADASFDVVIEVEIDRWVSWP